MSFIQGNRAILERYEVSRQSEAFVKNTTFKSSIIEWMVAISFKNVGGSDATVNGLELKQGSPMLTFDGELNMLDVTTYQLLFLADINPKVEVTRTYVVNVNIISKEIPMISPMV